MLDMSFYNGTLHREVAIDVIDTTTKKILYRYGFAYRGAKAYPITKEKAIEIINEKSLLDIKETDNEIILNSYSENDMW